MNSLVLVTKLNEPRVKVLLGGTVAAHTLTDKTSVS